MGAEFEDNRRLHPMVADLPGMLRRLGLRFEHDPLPMDVQSNGARDVLIVRL